jgi:uncharacterized protein (DUF1800 family)
MGFRRLAQHLAAVCLLSGLAACGGGDGSSATQSAADAGGNARALSATETALISPAATPTALVSKAQASRFLTQATFGPSAEQIDRVVALGYAGWLDEQFNTPASLHVPAVGYFADPISPKFLGVYPIQSSFWKQAATAPDALRQRVMFALSEIFVISVNDLAVLEYPRGVAAYMDMLAGNAFGNYRQLIEGVALHPMMGIYLSHRGNRKEDPAVGRIPDENFAREVMQLFSIGVDELNADGTPKRDSAGRTIDTYGNDDVMGLAKVFTGWSWYATEPTDEYFFAEQPIPLFFSPYSHPERDLRPMRLYPQFHSSSAKRFLGVNIPANTDGTTSVRIALDRLAAHPNMCPFIGRQLIQRLITSNPSKAYVARVSDACSNNGSGVRGDLKAMLRAILLDNEARTDSSPNEKRSPGTGKLREPILRVTAWMRAFNVQSRSGAWAYYFASDPVNSVGQAPLQSPSVFNFFRPGYVPPRSETGAAGRVAPEMQIVGETTVASWINVAESFTSPFGAGFLFDLVPDYTTEIALAGDPNALVERLNLLLGAGTMSAASKALIREAIVSVPENSFNWRDNRARLAVVMALASPDFIVQK